MNIFILDHNPRLAAINCCDKHVIKMILESAQLLCSAHHLFPTTDNNGLYKLTHKNHPCSIWVRQSLDNYKWLYEHAKALCKEYTFRYNKIHASEKIIDWCGQNFPSITSLGLTDFAQAMPEEYKRINPVEAYRLYYKKDKQYKIKFSYTKRNYPDWL